jgi:hypothetical protein
MFDLNEAIANWRRRLQSSPDVPPGDAEELEDHLRAGIADLRGRGLDEEEAFLISARRLGDPEALAGELATPDTRQRRRVRLRWLVVGALAVLLLFATDLIATFAASGLAALRVPGMALGVVAGMLRLVILLIGAALIWRLLTDDAAASRIRNLGVWSLGTFAAVLVTLGLTFGALLALGGSHFMLARFVAVPQIPLIAFYFRFGILLLLPVLLLLLLISLARPRSRA